MLGLWTESRQPKAETDGERYAFTVFIIFLIINIFVVFLCHCHHSLVD